MLSSVQSLLLEDGHRNECHREPKGGEWRELLRVFENVKTPRVAGRFVDELNGTLEPKEADFDKGPLALSLLPRLQEFTCGTRCERSPKLSYAGLNEFWMAQWTRRAGWYIGFRSQNFVTKTFFLNHNVLYIAFVNLFL
jgi:hypothetical protein